MLNSDHPLSILILGLRTDLTDKQLAELSNVMGTDACPWEALLALGNLHRVTLLWYLRLQQHGLTRQMPEDLRDYLDALLEENRARNSNLLAALDRCLQAFSRDGIDVVLLKGAAALADDLYGDPGARLMSDIDLLIISDQQEQVEKILLKLGFLTTQEDKAENRHHHLPPYQHPVWLVCLEIHLNITSSTERNAFPPDRIFGRAEALLLGDWPVKLMHTSDRLLHNSCHCIQHGADAGWLYSWCSLHELVQWNLLLRRADSTDFAELLSYAEKGCFAQQFKVYALLAQQLLGSPVPVDWCGRRERRHVERFLAGLAWRGSSSRIPAVVQRHYMWQFLPRAWHYHCYYWRQKPLLQRLTHLWELARQFATWKRFRLK